MKTRKSRLIPLLIFAGAVQAAGLPGVLDEYRAQGINRFDAQAGERLWKSTHLPREGAAARSCTTCHGDDPRMPGKHVRTGKPIDPMAAGSGKRLSDMKKIRKWFKRNCKWTLGRECSVQEQADVLAYLKAQGGMIK